MFVERLILNGFRCFPHESRRIDLSAGLTAFVGANGAGKTAVMQALSRLFGVTDRDRRMRRQDFHIPVDESSPPRERSLFIEAIISFPELDAEGLDDSAIPQFFQQMAAEENGKLKCRMRLDATWTDDGTLDGAVEQKSYVIRTLGAFDESDRIDLRPTDRSRIQMIYVPAARDAASQVDAFLRGRLWRAINWSAEVREIFDLAGATVNDTFNQQSAIDRVTKAMKTRWQEVHSAGTDTAPLLRPIDMRFHEFIRKVEVVFHPDEAGRERALEDLSDGQRSLFHIALTAAMLDVEGYVAGHPADAGFQADTVPFPALTLIAVEEPENHLAPFYLSRIVRQIENLTGGTRAQAVISSHSASILARVDPTQVRHFRLDLTDRTARVSAIRLPESAEDASKFVREAVRTYPELYFARFVVLGEGASEEVVLPRLADALGFAIDRSFVAVVPLGGRHVNHLWRLLNDLDIPYATLLDLDWGRAGGGWGRIKTVCAQLLVNGETPGAVFDTALDPAGSDATLAKFEGYDPSRYADLNTWVQWLKKFHVYFCSPLDLDYLMLQAFSSAYMMAEPGKIGPSAKGDPRIAVLGEDGQPWLYGAEHDLNLRWYRYLFLGRGKPSTHVRVLSALNSTALKGGMPAVLIELLDSIISRLNLRSAD